VSSYEVTGSPGVAVKGEAANIKKSGAIYGTTPRDERLTYDYMSI